MVKKIPPSYNDVIKWIERYFNQIPDIKTYRGFESSPEFAKDILSAKKKGVEFYIDPMLPIDIISVETKYEFIEKKKEEVNYYNLFWLSFNIDRSIKPKLLFYRFYLSRITKLKGVNIIIIILKNSEESLQKYLRNLCTKNGYGLWEIDLAEENKISELVKSKNYRLFMQDRFINNKDPKINFKYDIIIKKSDKITMFFEQFVREGVEAMVGITPNQIGKRYIERSVLDIVFDLEKISYKKTLQEFMTTHLIDKGDDYDFIGKLFSTLLKDCGINSKYSDFLKIFEAPLYNIFSASKAPVPYRDHYFHQFQVFLLGLRIIDKYYSSFDADIEKKWLITAAFHDISYPIQKFDIWAKQFFSDSLGIKDLGVTDIAKHFVDKSLLSSTADIIGELCKKHLPSKVLSGNWLRDQKDLIKIYHSIITESKHHGILSSIFLLKEAEKLKEANKLSPPDLFETVFIPSAFSISLHHNIKYSYKTTNDELKDTSLWPALNNHGLSSIDFRKDPLSYLLIFCDTAQEWGRPKDYPSSTNCEETNNNKSFLLEEFIIDNTNCHIKLKANFLSKDELFKFKIIELETVKEFLRKDNIINFQITLIDCASESKDYFMNGD